MEISARFPTGSVVFYARVKGDEYVSSTRSQDQLTADAFSKPASADCILAHLVRMSGHLHLKGASKDDDGTQAVFLLTDYTARLVDAKVLEVDLFLACEHFIETETDGFFPTIAKILKYLDKKGG